MTELDKGFDADGFYGALAHTVDGRGITWKQVSHETGVSASTLTRMAQGRRPDAASLAALSAWAGLNPSDFVRLPGKPASPEPLAVMATYFRADPNLTKDAAIALEAIVRAAYNQLKKPPENQ